MRLGYGGLFVMVGLLIGCDGETPALDGGSDAALVDAGSDAGPPPAYVPLTGTDPALDSAELAPLAGILEGVEVVGIGESVHTTGGELEMRARLIRYLVEELGYRAIALENPRILTATGIAPYIASCTGTAEDAALAMDPIWWDRSTLELFTWLCEYNQEHPSDAVTIHGVDVREPWDLFREAEATLTEAAPSDAAGLLDGMRTCLGVGFADRGAFFEDPMVRMYFSAAAQVPEADHDACLTGTAAAEAYVNTNRAALVAASSEREVEMLRLAVLSLAAFDATIYQLSRDALALANPPRDAAMAEIFMALRRLDFPDARTIVFAHNGHILGASDEVLAGQWRGVENLGTLIQNELGDRYAAIGQASRTTHIDWTTGPETILHDDETMLEPLLDQLGPAFLLVDTQEALRVTPPLWDPTLGYRVGFDTLFPATHYRALVFHRESPANDYFTPPPFSM